MKLDDFDPSAIDVEDQRGGNFGGGLPLGLGGGRLGCGTLVIALIAAAVFGVNPLQLIGALDQGTGQGTETQVGGPLPGQEGLAPAAPRAGTSASEICTLDEASRQTCNALSSLNKTWEPIFRQSNVPFSRPKLVFYSRQGQSGCGAAQSAMGPFYCPADNGIYLDTDFYRELGQRLGASGDFARNYVIAHEYGHHVQNLVGTSDQVRRLQQDAGDRAMANRLSVRLELQADCYAGVWAARNRDRIEPGDLEEGLTAAHQIGDDTLMQGAGQRPLEEAFTHGSSAQRMEWLRRGIETGNEDACDTFADLRRR
ncbi:neutral zinc metallopeptidase [Novosphingobium piscinae]|uniref:Neutral zinc metallopeptidase n=1 Tax=Novosphingobium piscinae TaxID=1507448 RepID=A0A7X1FW34_9SPHN|nr:neutral zinc metallopeptidase [Novosphingobium piscinae]MBC2668059.1 neutral zinc metallopeptidase [Novosphingobium piscinae]